MAGEPIESIVIAGGGSAGWMTAAVLAKALSGAVRITLVESEEIGTVGVGEATIPQIHLINAFLGFDEDEFIRETMASFKLGIQFNGWARPGDSYIHAFGEIGRSRGLLPFYQYWLRARMEGNKSRLWDYSVNALAAEANRFRRPSSDPGPPRVGDLKYAYHFDAALYARYLRRFAETAGVKRVEGKIVEVVQHPENGRIVTLKLASGGSVDGDFFIDCSGFRALLIEGALKSGYEEWSRWLPCDRAIAAPCKHGNAFRPYTQATAREAGWQWRIPLQHRVGNGHVFCSAYMGEDKATEILLGALEGALTADPRVLRFTTGMRTRQWIKNCLAIGLASGFLEPLESTSIHMIQSAISRLVSMFPDKRFDQRLIDEYNRQARFEAERIRDFIILHYHASEREGGEFWRACRSMAIPNTLRQKVELFRAAGRIYREHEELFTEFSWLQVLLGQGCVPVGYHPIADQLSCGELERFLSDLRTAAARAVETMPSHSAFIAANCAAPRIS